MKRKYMLIEVVCIALYIFFQLPAVYQRTRRTDSMRQILCECENKLFT